MKIVTTNLLNRFWKNGIVPIKNTITGKLDSSKIVNSLLTTTAGFALDARQGKALDDKITSLNSKLTDLFIVDLIIKSYNTPANGNGGGQIAYNPPIGYKALSIVNTASSTYKIKADASMNSNNEISISTQNITGAAVTTDINIWILCVKL